MGELENILPDELKKAAIVAGNELVLPYSEALRAIGVASQHHIAVLGLELFAIRKDGLLTVDYSGYDSGHIRDVPFIGDWNTYVVKMSDEAEIWIKAHRIDVSNGYVLTSASERELVDAKLRIEQS
jgi:hypothetical protein